MASVLVMEDDVEQASLIKDALSQNGHLVKTAYNGNEAWIMLQNIPVDVLITDIYVSRTPETQGVIGGIGLIGKIRNVTSQDTIFDAMSKMKIIAITGGRKLPRGQDPLELAEHFGADYSFRKPVRLENLRSKIDEFME